MKELTKAEEQIMQILWRLERAYVKEVLEEFPSPKPAYNTVSTIIRILETKGFIDHESFGKTYRYFPLIDKATYTQQHLSTLMGSYFGGSLQNMVSFFTQKNEVDVKELEAIMQLMSQQIKQQKDGESS